MDGFAAVGLFLVVSGYIKSEIDKKEMNAKMATRDAKVDAQIVRLDKKMDRNFVITLVISVVMPIFVKYVLK